MLSFFVFLFVLFHFGVYNAGTFLYCLLTLLSIFLFSGDEPPNGVAKPGFSSQFSLVREEKVSFFRRSKDCSMAVDSVFVLRHL